jgi:hypothetical protein
MEITAGKTTTSPATKFARQRLQKLFFSMRGV